MLMDMEGPCWWTWWGHTDGPGGAILMDMEGPYWWTWWGHTDGHGGAILMDMEGPYWWTTWGHTDGHGGAILMDLVWPYWWTWWGHTDGPGGVILMDFVGPYWWTWWGHTDGLCGAILMDLVGPYWWTLWGHSDGHGGATSWEPRTVWTYCQTKHREKGQCNWQGKRGSATDRAKGAVQLTGHTTRLSATLCVFIYMTVQQAELCYATQTDLSHFTKTPFQDRQVGEGGMADKRS